MPTTSSLYVGNLHPDVTELILYERFSEIGPVVSIRVCRNKQNGQSLGYAYVNYQKFEDAERALLKLNFSRIHDRPVRVMWSQRDSAALKTQAGNVFVKNLDETIDNQALYYIFAGFGNILSSKVATDEDNVSKGYGFVQFENEESATGAIEKLNGMLLNGRKIAVSKFLPKNQREAAKAGMYFTNVYVKNLPKDLDDQQLWDMFIKFGAIKSAKVMTEDDGSSKCFGFVDFVECNSAMKAIEELNGKCIEGKILYIARAQKKSEREKLKKERDVPFGEWATDRQLFVTNLKPDVDDSKLMRLFETFGKVLSATVMTDDEGKSRNFGFVNFLDNGDAQKAMAAMNGSVYDGRVLTVSIASPRRPGRPSSIGRGRIDDGQAVRD